MILTERIPLKSERYPKLLKEIYDPPPLLMARGVWPNWEERLWVAVVGARKATAFGRKKAREIGAALAETSCGVVSGLAYGVDAEAHKGCLEANGITWGVLGSGLDHFYPARNKSLATQMTEKGGYLSEFPLDSQPYPSHFIQRNRIISGLSQAVVIVEAAIHSGSLVTARYALEQGREVFVVMPPEEHVAYEGNKKLLDDGATPYESAEQVMEEIRHMDCNVSLRAERSNPCESHTGLLRRPAGSGTPRNDNPIMNLLKQPQSLDQLVHQTKLKPQQLLVELLELESKGFVKKLPGPLWQSL